MAIPPVTFASLPAASSAAGKVYFVTDIGSGVLFVSDGTLWKPAGGSAVIAASGAASSVTGTTAETTLATVSIPAGLMTARGSLRVTSLWSATNNANTKSLRLRFSGASGTVLWLYSSASFASVQNYYNIRNRDAANSQAGFAQNSASGSGNSSVAITAAAVDTSAATSLVLTGQLTNAGDAVALEGYGVELLIP